MIIPVKKTKSNIVLNLSYFITIYALEIDIFFSP